MNWFRNLSIGTKISLIASLAAIMVAGGILLLEANATTALIDEIGQLNIRQEIILIEQQLIRVQAGLETDATVLANTPGLIDAVAANDISSLRSLAISAVPALNIDDFDIVDVDGVHLIDTENEEADDETSEEELIAQSLLGIQRTTILKETRNGEDELLFVSIRPLRDTSGAIVGGFLIAREAGDEFLDILNFERPGIELSLLYNNQIIAASHAEDDNEANSGAIAVQLDLASLAISGTTAINPKVVYSDMGVPYTEAYVPIQGLNDRSPIGVVLVRVNNEAIKTFQQSLIFNSGVVLAILIGIALAVVIAVVYFTITQRLALLQQASLNIAQGDYTKHVDITGQDEVGVLAQTFNRMADDIQQRQTELHELNQTLERRVTERTVELKSARDEALASKRIADENSRLKSEFLSTMSHELRTPMNAIEGFTSIMLKRMAGVDYNDKAERYLTKVQANSQRLLGLINDFLDLSRIKSGRLELAYLPMSPAEMAQKWRDSLGVLADNKQIEFEVSVDEALPETMYGDEESISKIAINLVGNAFKFTEEGTVSLSLKKQDNWMVLEVRDTGIGIPPHARDFVFDEFRQVDQSSKRKHGGTGLGLAIVQKLVREMGGTVTLQSEVGVGSTFIVLLPIQTEKQVA